VNLGDLVGRWNKPCADRPHRFVCDDSVVCRRRRGQGACELDVDNIQGCTVFALRKGFADANDRGQVRAMNCRGLSCDRCIRFSVVRATFRMTNDGVGSTCSI